MHYTRVQGFRRGNSKLMTSDTKYSQYGRPCIFEACAFIHVWDLLGHLNVNAFNEHAGNKSIKPAMHGWSQSCLMQDHLWARPLIHRAAHKSLSSSLVKIFKVGCWVNLSLIRAYCASFPVFYFTPVKLLNHFYVQDHKAAAAECNSGFFPPATPHCSTNDAHH